MVDKQPDIRVSDKAQLRALQQALNQLDDGITVFDAELKLAGWNDRFFDMLDFPREFASHGTPFASFMRFNAERGEYGPGDIDKIVDHRVELARDFQAHYFERVRPGGQVIAVRGTPLDDGGFVTTYRDITAERQYILETDGLTKEFKGFVAVSDVGLKVRRGTIHALIGPNGAGKTTVFNLLTRFLKASSGRITFKGRDITLTEPHAIARLGLVRSFQISSVFAHMSVRENVRVALQRKHGMDFHFWRSARELDAFNDEADAILVRVGLQDFATTLGRRAVLWPQTRSGNRHHRGARSGGHAPRRADPGHGS